MDEYQNPNAVRGVKIWHEYGLRGPEIIMQKYPKLTSFDMGIMACIKIGVHEYNRAHPVYPTLWSVRFPNEKFPNVLPPETLSPHAYILQGDTCHMRGITWPASNKKFYDFPDLTEHQVRLLGTNFTGTILTLTQDYLTAKKNGFLPAPKGELEAHIFDTLDLFFVTYQKLFHDPSLEKALSEYALAVKSP